MGFQSRTLLLCGAIAGPLFTLIYLAEGATRADYDPLRHPVSSLALGERGWLQILNFLLAAALTMAFAVGVHRSSQRSAWGPLLIGLWATGLLGAGIFVADPIGGYPLGTPDRLPQPTTHGVLHDYLSLAGFIALTAACFVSARSGPPLWRLCCGLSALGFATAMVVSSVTFGQAGDQGDLAGLFQRIAITIAWSWQALLAFRFLRQGQHGGAERAVLHA
ncbi:DUF998 domain-containing protein [Actinomadura vinacea]